MINFTIIIGSYTVYSLNANIYKTFEWHKPISDYVYKMREQQIKKYVKTQTIQFKKKQFEYNASSAR